MYDKKNGYNAPDSVLLAKDLETSSVLCYHKVGGGSENADKNLKNIFKIGLKSSGKPHSEYFPFANAYKTSIFFRPYTSYSEKNYIVGVKMLPNTILANQEYRIQVGKNNEKRYNDSAMNIIEYNELSEQAEKQGKYISSNKELKSWNNHNNDLYIPEVVINAEIIELNKISYLSPNCIEILKQSYKNGEIDNTNPLIERFCPELLIKTNPIQKLSSSTPINSNNISNIKNTEYKKLSESFEKMSINDKNNNNFSFLDNLFCCFKGLKCKLNTNKKINKEFTNSQGDIISSL